ncbi:MAG: lysophospholipid acyltransferase family protein [Formosimonas sp.]
MAMVKKLLTHFNFHWRRLFTGLSFALFGLGGLFLSFCVFPFFLLIPNQQHRQHAARQVVQRTFRLFIEFMRFFGVLSYSIKGFERINQQQGLLIIPNHPTLLDVVFLVAFINQADCIVKASLFRNPFMTAILRATGYIANNANDAESLVNQCIERLRHGSNLIIFPEGTRTVVGQTHHLQRGAANIAIRGQIHPTPVLISCSPATLSKGEKWYNIPARKFHLSLKVQDAFSIAPYQGLVDSLAARLLTQHLTRYYNERVS